MLYGLGLGRRYRVMEFNRGISVYTEQRYHIVENEETDYYFAIVYGG